MKRLLFLLAFCSCLTVSAQDFKPDASFYGLGFWQPDTLGNHRVVVNVDKPSDIAEAYIPWRRRDKNTEEKGIVIIDAQSGKQIHNFYRKSIRQEAGNILFQAPTAGNYYIYYLPYKTSGGPYPKIKYPKETSRPDAAWLAKAQKADKNLPQAQLVQFQALSSFDSFYPMEIIATPKESQALLDQNKDKKFLLFAENRNNPIKMYYDIPYHWAAQGAGREFSAEADLNEYFVFQIGLWATQGDVNNVKVTFSDLQGSQNTIPASAFTCFNTSGKNWIQQDMNISPNVPKGKVQPLWMGVQIPTDIKMGTYRGKVTIQGANLAPQTIDINLQVSDHILTDKGDSDIYRLSRLRWLNSDLGVTDQVVKPFIPLTYNDKTIHCLGRSVTLNQFGFPADISSFFTEEVTTIGDKATPVLTSPFNFVIQQNKKALPWKNESFKFTQKDGSTGSWETRNKVGSLDVNCNASMEFDGFMKYTVTVKATENTAIEDIRLEIPMNEQIAKYWLGMGHRGSSIPDKNNWKWDVKKNQEGFWIGDVNAGLHCVFRDEHYVRPLNTNFYQSKPLIIPECWNNNGKGGIDFARKGNTMLIKTYSGSRELKKGEEITFIFLSSVTPFKPIDTQKQWSDRYFHAYQPIDKIVAEGANTINVHHAHPINPYINYPFFRPDFMKSYIDEAHAKGAKVKIYYTVRELPNRVPELYALRSLGHEIFSEGKGNGFAWLQEHLDQDYIAAWFVDKYTDAAIITSGVSRWHNYYIEGLNWLVQNVGIDGLYIDDLAFDRNTMKRIRRILENGCPAPRIDLHSANQFNNGDGFINSACLYMEHMPYLDRLWLGEYFDYNSKPDFWMTEVSGIPFGMMGEMLQDGGNPWRGMVYGITSRLPYEGHLVPKFLWQAWDDFGIKDSRMIGYWVSYNPVKTNNKDVLSTSYVRDGKVMIAVASWADKDVDVKLNIDWKQLKMDPKKATLKAPEIQEFQSAMTLSPDQSFRIEKGKGYLFILE